MSNKERCYAIIDSFTEEQLSNIAALLTSARSLADETADDIYCLRLYEDYQADKEKGEPVNLEKFIQDLGIAL